MELCDFSGLECPLPVIYAHRKLARLSPGEKIAVKSTDPLAQYDFPDYCQSSGNILESAEAVTDAWVFVISKPSRCVSDLSLIG
jgi:tRNA 2-thiouridine synthesizing protein A